MAGEVPTEGVPRVTLRMALLLRAMGVRSYEPGVLVQLAEVMHTHGQDVLTDGEIRPSSSPQRRLSHRRRSFAALQFARTRPATAADQTATAPRHRRAPDDASQVKTHRRAIHGRPCIVASLYGRCRSGRSLVVTYLSPSARGPTGALSDRAPPPRALGHAPAPALSICGSLHRRPPRWPVTAR